MKYAEGQGEYGRRDLWLKVEEIKLETKPKLKGRGEEGRMVFLILQIFILQRRGEQS